MEDVPVEELDHLDTKIGIGNSRYDAIKVVLSESLIPNQDLEFFQEHLLHDSEKCDLEVACIVHNPSEHPMNFWPILLAPDNLGIIQRPCSHAFHHPDPDSLRWVNKVKLKNVDETHLCDGCCQGVDYGEF